MKKTIFLFSIISLFSFACKKNTKTYINYYDKDTLTYKIIKLDSGWGYKIFKNKHTFIYQNIIPAVNGYFVFKKPKDAEITAKFVIHKLTQKAGFPTLTVNELDSLGVLDSNIINYQIKYFSKQNPKVLKSFKFIKKK
jgi:hypothetical protein